MRQRFRITTTTTTGTMIKYTSPVVSRTHQKMLTQSCTVSIVRNFEREHFHESVISSTAYTKSIIRLSKFAEKSFMDESRSTTASFYYGWEHQKLSNLGYIYLAFILGVKVWLRDCVQWTETWDSQDIGGNHGHASLVWGWGGITVIHYWKQIVTGGFSFFVLHP